MLVVHPALPVKTVQDLIALAKSKPGALNYGSAGTATGTHLSAELFKYMTGTDMVHVPYKGGGAAMPALLGGQVQLMFSTTVDGHAARAGGKLRAVAVTSGKRWPSAAGHSDDRRIRRARAMITRHGTAFSRLRRRRARSSHG